MFVNYFLSVSFNVLSITRQCEKHEFKCDGGNVCWPTWYLCDGVKTCQDGYDEDRDVCREQVQ